VTATPLLFSDEEEQLRTAVARRLTARRDLAGTLRRAETDDPYDHDLWRSLGVELGVTGLLIPDEFGGQGATAREVGVVCEELGREAAAVPFLGSAVLATAVLAACSDRAAGDLLRALAASETTVAVALPWRTSPGAALEPSVTAGANGLTGSVQGVLDGGPADVLVVPARHYGHDGHDGQGSPGGHGDIVLCAVPVEGTGVDTTVVRGIDLTRGWIDLRLDGAEHEVLATSDGAVAALSSGLLHAAAMVAAEQVGVAQACLDRTVEYVSTRHQFGRPVGSFQSLKHRLADVWLGVIGARAAARHATDALARNADDRGIAVAVAKAHCSEIAVLAAEESLQMHGGIGMTWEHPTHIFLKRAKLDELLFGTPGRHRSELAALVDLPMSD
jgi:alkylation response protein AidB-like acyl-CoA dehydrogenase